MMTNPMEYLSLDHDWLSKIALFLIVTSITTEVTTLFLVYGTLCTKVR